MQKKVFRGRSRQMDVHQLRIWQKLCQNLAQRFHSTTSIIAIYGNNTIWHMVANWKQVQHEMIGNIMSCIFTHSRMWLNENVELDFVKVFAIFLIDVHPFDTSV